MAIGGGRLARVLNLIGHVYDAALDERLWGGLASEIGAAFDAPGTAVFTVGGGPTEYLSATENHQIMRAAYEEHFHKVDPFVKAGIFSKPYECFVNQEILSDREYFETELYQDFCRHVDVFHVLGSVAPVDDEKFAAIGIHRPQHSAAFDEGDKLAGTLLLPHLVRAFQIRCRLAESETTQYAALDGLRRTGTAILIVLSDGQILYANDEAERLLRERSVLSVHNGRVAATSRKAGDQLAALIRAAVNTAGGLAASSGGAIAIERDGGLPLTLLVAPFRPVREGFGPAVPAAVVFIRDSERATPMTQALQGLFGLTVAEACIAGLLAQGYSTDDIARSQRITPNTVRVHLKSTFAKTGTTRQAQLVALILRSVATIS